MLPPSAFAKVMILPTLGSLAGEEPASVDAVLASYDHSNTINLFALGALVAWLRGETAAAGHAGAGAAAAGAGRGFAEACLGGGRVGRNLATRSAAQPLRRSAAAADPGQHVPASRTCAGISCSGSRQCWHRSRPTARSIARSRPIARLRRERARVLARAISAKRPALADRIESGVSAFVDHAIGKMVTICRAIRVARGRLSS